MAASSNTSSRSTINFTFPCGLRGYHVYQEIWTPIVGERLHCRRERNNRHDRYAIAAHTKLPGSIIESIVGHLPKELFRITYYIIEHGTRVSARVISAHQRKSPIIKGGLEIPIEVTVEMESTEKNCLTIKAYEKWTSSKYKDPIDGEHEDATDSILAELKTGFSDTDTSLHLRL